MDTHGRIAPEARVEETIYSNQDTAEAMRTVFKPVDARIILNCRPHVP